MGQHIHRTNAAKNNTPQKVTIHSGLATNSHSGVKTNCVSQKEKRKNVTERMISSLMNRAGPVQGPISLTTETSGHSA